MYTRYESAFGGSGKSSLSRTVTCQTTRQATRAEIGSDRLSSDWLAEGEGAVKVETVQLAGGGETLLVLVSGKGAKC